MTLTEIKTRTDEIRTLSTKVSAAEVTAMFDSVFKIIGYHEQTIRLLKREVRQRRSQ